MTSWKVNQSIFKYQIDQLQDDNMIDDDDDDCKGKSEMISNDDKTIS